MINETRDFMNRPKDEAGVKRTIKINRIIRHN